MFKTKWKRKDGQGRYFCHVRRHPSWKHTRRPSPSSLEAPSYRCCQKVDCCMVGQSTWLYLVNTNMEHLAVTLQLTTGSQLNSFKNVHLLTLDLHNIRQHARHTEMMSPESRRKSDNHLLKFRHHSWPLTTNNELNWNIPGTPGMVTAREKSWPSGL